MSVYNKKTLAITTEFLDTYKHLKANNISTICVEASCPNAVECFSKKRATFLVMGDLCTRNCSYCSVHSAKIGKPLDIGEMDAIVECIKLYGFRHVVLTSVTRDDLYDGGSSYLAKCVSVIKDATKKVSVELLTPDFSYNEQSIKTIVESEADILAHNIETVRSYYPTLRKKSSYDDSLKLLSKYAAYKPTKSGIMVGFGESIDDIKHTVTDLANSGVRHLTIGQYLPPSKSFFVPSKYYSDEEFDYLHDLVNNNFDFEKINIGFYARSSYLDLA